MPRQRGTGQRMDQAQPVELSEPIEPGAPPVAPPDSGRISRVTTVKTIESGIPIEADEEAPGDPDEVERAFLEEHGDGAYFKVFARDDNTVGELSYSGIMPCPATLEQVVIRIASWGAIPRGSRGRVQLRKCLRVGNRGIGNRTFSVSVPGLDQLPPSASIAAGNGSTDARLARLEELVVRLGDRMVAGPPAPPVDAIATVKAVAEMFSALRPAPAPPSALEPLALKLIDAAIKGGGNGGKGGTDWGEVLKSGLEVLPDLVDAVGKALSPAAQQVGVIELGQPPAGAVPLEPATDPAQAPGNVIGGG